MSKLLCYRLFVAVVVAVACAGGIVAGARGADDAVWIDYSQAPHPSVSYLDQLMKDLRSESFAVRLEAQRKVLDLGPVAVEALVREVGKSKGEERELKDAIRKSWTLVAPIMVQELQKEGYQGGRWIAEGYLWRICSDFRTMYMGGREPTRAEFDAAMRKCEDWLAEHKAEVGAQFEALKRGVKISYACDSPQVQRLVRVRFTVRNDLPDKAVVLDRIRCINPEVTMVLEPDWAGDARYTGPAGGPTKVKDGILAPGMSADGEVVIRAVEVPDDDLVFTLSCKVASFDDLRENCIVLSAGRVIPNQPDHPTGYSDSDLISAAKSKDLVWRETEFVARPFSTRIALSGDAQSESAARAKAGISEDCPVAFSGYYSAWVFAASEKTVLVPKAGPPVILSDMIKLGVFDRVDAAAAKGESEITLQAGTDASLNLGVKLRKEGPVAVFTSSLVNLIDDLKKVSASSDLNKVRKQNEVIH
jgi:hypothetical protein